MHQSLTFSIQWRYTFLNFFGKNSTSSFITLLRAGVAISFIFKNHCVESFGSITTSVRSEYPILLVYSSTFARFPAALISFVISVRTANLSFPTYNCAASERVPLSLKISITSRLFFNPIV